MAQSVGDTRASGDAAWWGEDIVPRIRWRIAIEEGGEIPDGYGLAWRDWSRRGGICMPIGINVVAGALRACYQWLRGGFYVSGFDPRYQDAINHGEARGLEYGWERGYSDALFDQQLPTTYPKQHNPYRCTQCRVTR